MRLTTERLVYCVTTMPAPTGQTHRVRWAVLVTAALLVMFYLIGAHAQAAQAEAAATAAVTTQCVPDAPTGDHMTFNKCARLDTTQVQDQRPVWSDGVAACQEEDGSTAGQQFPCRWESADGGSFTLDGPASR